jgi:hypothetical protein
MSGFAKAIITCFVTLCMVFGTMLIPAWAQGPDVDHSAPSCVSTEGFPKFSANISGDLSAPPRVYFRCEPKCEELLFVGMTQVGNTHEAVLPTPILPDCEKLVYYVQAIDSEGNTSQTPEVSLDVTSGTCAADKLPASATPDIAVFDAEEQRADDVPCFALAPLAASQGGSVLKNPWLWVGIGGAGATAVVLATRDKEEASPVR